MLETLDYTIRIGSTTTILYFDFYLYSAYAAHYVYYSTYDLHTHTQSVWKHLFYHNTSRTFCDSILEYSVALDSVFGMN